MITIAGNLHPITSMVEPSMVIGYPNLVGDVGRYVLSDQRNYFSKFEGGSCGVFELALNNVIDGDLLNYADQCEDIFKKHYCHYSYQCNELFDNHYQALFEENTATNENFFTDKKEFNRRIFDIYRFAKTSVAATIPDKPLHLVRKILTNPKYDSGAFLIK